MVGQPKNLADLRKIDADLRVVCRACGRRRVFDRELLHSDLLRRGKSTDWTLMPRHFRCSGRGCRSRDVRLEILPFARREVPPVLATFLAAVEAYVEARTAPGVESERLSRIGLAARQLEAAKQALLMWAQHGVHPEAKQEPR